MKIKDKNLNVMVSVYSRTCIYMPCYWPRTNPGVFTQGSGYKNATSEMLCGTRHVHGCPTFWEDTAAEKEQK